jgi:hypothetical protein
MQEVDDKKFRFHHKTERSQQFKIVHGGKGNQDEGKIKHSCLKGKTRRLMSF